MSIPSTTNSPIRYFAPLAGIFGLFCAAHGALAQQQPAPFPWEKNTDKFFSRGIPKTENPIDRQINEGLKRLGLPPQPKLDITGEEVTAPEPPGLSATVLPQLDTNRDGYVTREEYMIGRRRGASAGVRGKQQYVHRTQRFDSRFRAADRNRDGRLSADEIDRMAGSRF